MHRERENVNYQDRISGMLEAYRATPYPATTKSPYELMFGRKMNLSIFPTVKREKKDTSVRNHDRKYKVKAKLYHDKKSKVKSRRLKWAIKFL